MPEDISLELGHLRLAARRWNAGAPGRILAVHGWLDNAGSFDGLAPGLDGFEVVALDLVGHGWSDWRPPGAFYHFIDAVADVVGAVQALGWDRLNLLGHSMGAGVTPLVAAALGPRVARLVCIEGLGPYTSPAEEAPDLLRRSLAHTLNGSAPVYPDWEDVLVRLERRGLSRKAAEALAARGARQVEGGYSFVYDPRLRGVSRARLTEDQIRAFLRQIQAPTLLIEGEQGIPSFWEGRQSCLCALTELKAAGGHHLHLEDPEPIRAPILQFLGES